MNRYPSRIVPLAAIVVLAFLFSSCVSSNQGTPKTNAKVSEEVVARIGDQTITQADLDQATEGDLSQVNEQIYEIKRSRLEALVADRLWALEAEERGITVKELRRLVTEDATGAPAMVERSFLVYLGQKYPIHLYLDPPRYTVSIEESPVQGPAEAPITFVEVTDFECPFCSRVQPTLQKIRDTFGAHIRFVFKHFPLAPHRRARSAHIAALCAEEQGKFWEYRALLFEYQRDLSRSAIMTHAKSLGLEVDQFRTCLKEERYADRIDRDLEEAMNLGVSGTPTFFINGRRLSGAQPFIIFQRVVEEELARSVS